jgi:hypothetical protein
MAKVPRKSTKKETSFEQWAREAKENAGKTAKIDPAALKYRYDEAAKIAQELVSLPAEYPLELVANIASRLLVGEDYQGAANRALRLLQACNQTQEKIKDRKEFLNAKFMRAAGESDDFEFPEGLYRMPYVEAIKFITGQKRHDRAEEDYLRFSEAIKPSQSKSELNKALKLEESQGIDAGIARKLRRQFDELREQGKLDKRARPTEKI